MSSTEDVPYEFLYEYEKDSDGNDIYDYSRSRQEFFCKLKDRNIWIYATKYLDEYLPEDGRIAFQEISPNESYPAYPLTENKIVIFPKNERGDEMWIYSEERGQTVYLSLMGKFERYPKTIEGREIYPIYRSGDVFGEIPDVVFDTYARNERGKFYYPLVTNGHESIFDVEFFKENVNDFEDYPLAEDGTILVPYIEGAPFFTSHFKTNVLNTDLKVETIDGKEIFQLLTDDYMQYILTNKKPKSDGKRELDGQYFYVISRENDKLGQTLQIPTTKKTTSSTIPFVYYGSILLLMTIIIISLVLYFAFRNKI